MSRMKYSLLVLSSLKNSLILTYCTPLLVFKMSVRIKQQYKYEFPYEITFVEKEINQELLEYFKGESKGFVQVGKEQWLLPYKYLSDSNDIYNFEVRPDDTWIITFPRSGTTLMQELVWLVENNLNYELAIKSNLYKRVPFIEYSTLIEEKLRNMLLVENVNNHEILKYLVKSTARMWEVLDKTQSPRFIKTHLPFSLLPPTLLTSGCKIIYVARNPKDVAASFYHLNKLVKIYGFVGDFPKFWEFFQKNLVHGAPYWSHVKEGWKLKDHPNLQFLFYEDIIKDTPATIRKISSFLKKSYSSQQIDELAEFLSIESTKKRYSCGRFLIVETGMMNMGEGKYMMQGGITGWSHYFTPELNKIADKWIAENLADTDMRFPV